MLPLTLSQTHFIRDEAPALLGQGEADPCFLKVVQGMPEFLRDHVEAGGGVHFHVNMSVLKLFL